MATKSAFLEDAFPLEEHRELKTGILKVIETDKKSLALFKNIAKYAKSLQTQINRLEKQNSKQAETIEGLKKDVGTMKGELKAAQEKVKDLQGRMQDLSLNQNQTQTGGPGSPGPKKRKLDGGELSGSGRASPMRGVEDGQEQHHHQKQQQQQKPKGIGKLLLTIPDISFSVPARKKFNINVMEGGLDVVVPATGIKEFGIAWEDIKHVCCLPVPEKTTRQFNFCVFPNGAEGLGLESSSTNTNGSSTGANQGTGTVADALVFTVADSPIKPSGFSGEASARYDSSNYQNLFTSIFNTHLESSSSDSKGSKVLTTDLKEFFSSIPQPHRRNERAFHVKCHRGSKEGYLFFLSNGIVWGFKKPLAYFEFVNIDSISYTSITMRTFNLSIHVRGDKPVEEGGKEIEIEFAMIDQGDYGGIDQYIKRHELNDKSMAEKRRAVKYNVNKEGGGKEGEEAEGEGDRKGKKSEQGRVSELEKALEDAEDEDEEDYDPGSEGESDGSGSDSEDGSEDDEEEDEEDEEDDDENEQIDLREELGSELEDVGESGDEMDTRKG